MELKKQINTVQIPAIHDKDLRTILDRYGISAKIDNGTINCEFCSGKISWSNIGALMVKNNSIVLCCNLVDCINSATSEKPHGTST